MPPKDEQQPFGLGHYMDEQLKVLRAKVPAALKHGETEAVHHCRVATRRLKAALDLIAPEIEPGHFRSFDKTLRKLRKRLGVLRDMDVMRAHLTKFAVEDEAFAPAAQWLQERCLCRRHEEWTASARKESAAHVLARLGQWWGLQEEVNDIRIKVDGLLAVSLREQVACFSAEAEAIVAPPADQTQPSDTHALRIAGKRLRYTLEMAVEQGHRLPQEILAVFKKMQDALGLWHDYVVMTEFMMTTSAQNMLPHHQSNLQAQVLDLAKATLHRAENQLTAFGNLWKEYGREIVRVVEDLFPEGTIPIPVLPPAEMVEKNADKPGATIIESQTGPDPLGSAETPSTGSTASTDRPNA